MDLHTLLVIVQKLSLDSALSQLNVPCGDSNGCITAVACATLVEGGRGGWVGGLGKGKTEKAGGDQLQQKQSKMAKVIRMKHPHHEPAWLGAS